ncbi:glutamate-5-semialdehyde dehydrogenase [Maricaulis parjimensis]|uniref:glutamate-5-semialdehyde dehydrogenase n=1 Tax=Maricaulis parjimensis TaxID=144023 RepID=UPI00193A793D|nr:glutamate-5-semialdehyde dehydrogenase [Maricaulis parjimensis]
MSDRMQVYIEQLGRQARDAARQLATASTERKNAALIAAAAALRLRANDLIEANQTDVASVREAGKPDAFIDRLMLDGERIEGVARALEQIAELPDPVGRQLAQMDRPNGLRIERVAVPLGVIGMIYESRPNVGADAGALCLKSGNAVILRGGSESLNSTRIIVECMKDGLREADLPEDAIQMVDTTNRAAVQHLLQCTEYVDLVIPRGGKGLVSLVRDQARVPTLLHLDGNCHTYIHESADLTKARAIVRNAKLRRTGICGATESLVIDQAVAADFLPGLLDEMSDCEFRGDETATAIDSRIKPADETDWSTEYLDSILSVKIVADLQDALNWVSAHSSAHTDAIVAEDEDVAAVFLNTIDSAVVMHNASTQFSDGGEFGMGAEIGIATGKMHARGPVGLEQLTSFKYLVHGTGQTRP